MAAGVATKEAEVAGCKEKVLLFNARINWLLYTTESSVSDLCGREGFLQLPQEATASVRLHSADSEQLSTT